MLRRRLLIPAAIALLWPVATAAPSGGAVEPDLVVSATSGAARSVIEVSSASCVDDPDGSIIRYLSVRLVSGAPGSEVLAGAGTGGEGEAARFVVPDWIDPADPAQIVARCLEFDFTFDTPGGDIPSVAVPYDPVAFDVLDPTEPAVQAVAYSRTALATGQGFVADLQGCFLEGSLEVAGTEVLTGSDLSGATGQGVVFGDAAAEGDAASVPVLMNDSGTGLGWSQTGDDRPVIDVVEERSSSIAPGPHAAFPFCATLSDAGVTYLYFPPTDLEVTGSSPMDDIDLVTTPGSREVEVAGGCEQAEVSGTFRGLEIEAESTDFLRTSAGDDGTGLVGPVLRPTVDTAAASGRRAISGYDLDETPFSAVPAADGAWEATDEAAFDLGAVWAYAACGDPFGDGYSYDAQIAAIDVPPPVETTTTTTVTTTTAPPPPPAQSVPGTPAYAG